MRTVGIIGAGHIGGAVARAVSRAGHDVIVSNAHGPESLADLVRELGPGARAATVEQAAGLGDPVVVAVPLGQISAVPAEPLEGKVVITTANYNPSRDGHIAVIDAGTTTVASLVQAHLPRSRVAKGFSMLSAAELTTDGKPRGARGRRALAVAGNPEATRVVAELYEELGFDVVDVGPLDESWRFERGQPAFVARQTAEQLRANLARATRTRKK
jgi:predicted dinucleotide-binding enzyme